MPIEKSDLLQGTLDMLILKIVALGPVHGYGISQRIRQISKEVLQVQQGSLYPALHRLEKRGWLVVGGRRCPVHWAVDALPSRRFAQAGSKNKVLFPGAISARPTPCRGVRGH